MVIDQLERSENLSFASDKIIIFPKVELALNLLKIKNTTIIHHHIPKSGATNVGNLIKAMSISLGIVEIRASIPRQDGISPTQFTKGSLGGIPTIKAYPELFDCQKKRINFIGGHLPFFNDKNLVKYFNTKNVSHIAIMRDPIERELSSGNFMYQRGYINSSDIKHYLLNVAIDNLQTRFLAGENHMLGDCTDATFEQAKQNTAKFEFIATTDHLDIVMSSLATIFGLNHVAYSPAQVTGMKIFTKETDPELSTALETKHLYDIKLYEYIAYKWKNYVDKNIKVIPETIIDNQIYTVLASDFSHTKTPIMMNLSEIHEASGNGLRILQQKHNIVPIDSPIIQHEALIEVEFSAQGEPLLNGLASDNTIFI